MHLGPEASAVQAIQFRYWISLQTLNHVNHSFPIARVSGASRRLQCRPYRRPSFLVFGVFRSLRAFGLFFSRTGTLDSAEKLKGHTGDRPFLSLVCWIAQGLKSECQLQMSAVQALHEAV